MKNEITVITGGASGIGRGLAELILKDSGIVYVLDINEPALQDFSEWAHRFDYQLITKKIDITRFEEIEDFIKNLESDKKRVSTWINSAAVNGLGAFEKLTEKEFETIVEINLISLTRICRVVMKYMHSNGFGKIVNIASVAGFVPCPMMSAYNLTKHAVVGFTRSLQLEMKWTDSPVKFVLVSPGFVDTNIINKNQELGFPEWLSPLLAKPDSVAKEIHSGLKKNKTEIFPTINGKALMTLHKHFPRLVTSQSRILMTKSLTDFLLNRR